MSFSTEPPQASEMWAMLHAVRISSASCSSACAACHLSSIPTGTHTHAPGALQEFGEQFLSSCSLGPEVGSRCPAPPPPTAGTEVR